MPEPASDFRGVLSERIEALRGEMALNDRRYSERFEYQEAAIVKAEIASQKRLEGMNEFRGTIQDVTGLKIDRSEVQVMFRSLAERVDIVAKAVDRIENQSAGKAAFWGYIVGGVGLFTGLTTVLLRLAGK